MLAIIRVLTTRDQGILKKHGNIIEDLYGISARSYCIPDQPYGIHDAATELKALPKIVMVAKQAEADGATCILISCAADPGLEEARAAVDIPVLGAGTCAAAIALALGQRVGVLNLTGRTPASLAAVLGSRLEMEIAPEGVDNTTDLMKPNGEAAAVLALNTLAEQCDVVLLACTGFSTIGFAAKMQIQLKIPLVDAVEAAGAVAQVALQKKLRKV